jgi:SSS family solute:Na+ symporter
VAGGRLRLFQRHGANAAGTALILKVFPSWLAGFTFAAIAIGALVFVIFIPLQYAIYLQLLGGVWISQTLPAVIGGLFTRWFHDRALLVGWLAGIAAGTAMAVAVGFKPIYPFAIGGFGFPCYIALAALVLNFAVAIVLTPVFDALNAGRGHDDTEAAHTV